MSNYVALLRAVNVGGTGKLAMSDLAEMCGELGFQQVKTYIASGNVVFTSALEPGQVQRSLEQRLLEFAKKPIGVVVRTAAQMADVLATNPFPQAAPNRVVAIFLDHAPAADALEHAVGWNDEQAQLGVGEIYVHYGQGMADSKLRIPAAAAGTARNMNTVAKLAAMTAALDLR